VSGPQPAPHPPRLARLLERLGAKGPVLWVPLLVLAAIVMVGGVLVTMDSAAPPVGTTTIPPQPETSVAADPPTSSTVPITASTAPGRPRTVTTLPSDISGGVARISGTVVGPAGPVPNALIRVERLLGANVAVLNVTATATGAYSLPSVRGGSYRIKAWRVPDLVMLQPEAFFLGADEQKPLDLRLTAVTDTNVQTVVEPSSIPKEDPFNIVVTVYAGAVTAEGNIQGTTRNGVAVQIALRTNLGLQGPDRGVTDTNGKFTFRVRCVAPGPAEADAVFPNLRLPLNLPNCPA